MQKDDLNVHVFHYKNWSSPKSDWWFFSLTLTVRPYHRQDLSEKKYEKNHQIIRSRCLIDEFSFTDIFNDINHGHRAAILKKKNLWLLPFYIPVATCFYYDKVCRTMGTAIISYLLKQKTWKQKSIFCPSILCQRNSIESTPIFRPSNLQQKCISKKR